jgi:hypothetical protein
MSFVNTFISTVAAAGILAQMPYQSSDIFSFFIILLAIVSAAWFAIFKKK